MKITFQKDAGKLTVAIEGSVDTVTASELEKELKANWAGVTELVLDFAAVNYISSAGLRVVMVSNQHMEEVGSMVILNANEDVKEVFEMTVFDELLTMK